MGAMVGTDPRKVLAAFAARRAQEGGWQLYPHVNATDPAQITQEE